MRFSSIGDIVLTTPIIRCTKLQMKVEIHYLTKESYRPLLETNPYIDKIITINEHVKEVIPQLRDEGYELLIDLHKSLRSFLLKRQLRIPTYSFDKINWEKWLMVNLKINRLPNVHIVDRYFQSVQNLGVKNDGKGLDYFIPKGMEEFKLEKLKFEIGKKYIAFAIGAKHKTKRLPKEKILEICKKINSPIILLGGKDVEDDAKEIAKQVGSHVINACGKLNLHESAIIIRDAEKVITHDTGLMHIAAAFQKEIISIWGNTIPEFGMYPYYEKGIDKNLFLEVKGLSCRPCSKIGFEQCPKGHFKCMRDLPLDFEF